MGQFVAVGHRDEMAKQLALLEHGEIALVLLHHRDQHRGRQGQVFVLESAQNGLGRLHQIRDFFQQGWFIRDNRANTGGSLGHELGHQLTAFGALHDDTLGADGVEVTLRIGNLKGGEAAWGQLGRCIGKAWAAAAATAGNVGPGERYYLVTIESHDPAQGA